VGFLPIHEVEYQPSDNRRSTIEWYVFFTLHMIDTKVGAMHMWGLVRAGALYYITSARLLVTNDSSEYSSSENGI
jgi:hypothetical protein